VTPKTLTVDRIPLPPGFRMFILPEYRLVTPTYSVKLSRTHGTILSILLANFQHPVRRSDIVDILWGDLENGGPEDAANTLNVTLVNIRAKFLSVGIGIDFGAKRRDGAARVDDLKECEPVGCPYNKARRKALRDRQSPNPARGLKKPPNTLLVPSAEKPRPKKPRPPKPPAQKPLYAYVERPRSSAPWTHNARAEAYFGEEGPT
jgi:hypothetical protein